MKTFCGFLREHAMRMIISKTKKMKLLTKEQQASYENLKICDICKENFENKYLKDKKYCKVRDHCHYIGEYGGCCSIAYVIQNIVCLKKLL